MERAFQFIAAVCCLNLIFPKSYSQDFIDNDASGYYSSALKFSRDGLIGTARTQAHGGAQQALGGDMGTM